MLDSRIPLCKMVGCLIVQTDESFQCVEVVRSVPHGEPPATAILTNRDPALAGKRNDLYVALPAQFTDPPITLL